MSDEIVVRDKEPLVQPGPVAAGSEISASVSERSRKNSSVNIREILSEHIHVIGYSF